MERTIMKWKKYPFRQIALVGWLFFCLTPLFGEVRLLSIKKGKEENKCWAVFYFNETAHWVGVSQKEEKKLCLFFAGVAGEMDGKTIILDKEHEKMIVLKQMTQTPPIFRAELTYDGEEPLAVLKKNKNLVIGLNDYRLLEGKVTGFDESISVPGRLVKVSPIVTDEKVTTSLQFDGTYDWVGYVKPSVDEAFLLIRGARLFTGNQDFSFEEGPLQTVRFSSQDDQDESWKAEMYFAPPSSFAIVRKDQRLMIQTPKTIESEKVLSLAEHTMPVSPVTDTTAVEDSVLTVVQPVDMGMAKPATAQIEEEVPESSQITETESIEEQEVQEEEDEVIPWDRRVSFKFHSTPIKSALRLVASSNNLNMVIGEGIEGEVTMNLENVTLKQALDMIVHTHNCEYILEENIITVKPVGIAFAGGRITKVYRLKYADAINVAKVVRNIVTNDSLVEVFHPEFLNFPEAGKNRQSVNKVAVQGIRRSSTLVVTDRPEKIQEVDLIIAELDQPPIQIMIESKLVELAPNYSDRLGIDWDKTLSAQLWDARNIGSSQMDYSVINASVEKLGEWKMGYLSAGQYQVVIDFLKEKTDSKLISNPRLLALDNEESSISVGTTVPIPRIQRGLGGTGDMVTFEYKEVNIQLNVTPHAGDNEEVTMYVNPVIEEIADWVYYEDHRAPVTNKRTVNSIVTVANGETVVIGGLIKTQRVETMKKVWFLGSLPLFGKFFQHKHIEDKQTDLMIFITPTILKMG
jgi:type IV pilus assembly protein PilQ